MGFKETRVITLPTIKFNDNTTMVLRFDGPAQLKKTTEKDEKTGEEVEKELYVALVTDLENDIRGEMVLPEYMLDNLADGCEGGNYVGKIFQITKETVQGKRWRKYTILEGEWE